MMKHSSRFHSKSWLGEGRDNVAREKKAGGTYVSHVNDHRKLRVPVYLSSTTLEGLYSSSVLCLVVALGAVALARSASESGSAW